MIITKNLEDQQVINIVKSHCVDLKKITNKKRVVIIDHPFDAKMDTFFLITRVKGEKLWEINYHEPHVSNNILIVDQNFCVVSITSV